MRNWIGDGGNMGNTRKRTFFSAAVVLTAALLAGSIRVAGAQVYTLRKTVDTALEANLELKITREAALGAEAAKKAQFTQFLPTFEATYNYQHLYEEDRDPMLGLVAPRDSFRLTATVRQPVFRGFSLYHQYRIKQLGYDIARVSEQLVRQDIILAAKNAFFSILKTQKLVGVAEEATALLEAHLNVAENFHAVGMIPKNDLLKAQVELANARQDLIVAQNNLEIARSNFNLLLRRPVNETVDIEDIIVYTTFERSIESCIETARENRLEIEIAGTDVEIARHSVGVGKSRYFPTVDVQANYYQTGEDWDLDGGGGVFEDPSSWDISAMASWTLWEWGRRYHDIRELKSELARAKYRREQTIDEIELEVKQSYLNTKQAEQNIIAVQKAVEQAKESFRITDKRYKEQMATTTDVLDAQTLLSKTMTNYYNALYDFKIAKATLFRAMGLEVYE